MSKRINPETGTSGSDTITYYKNAKVKKDETGRLLEETFNNGTDSITVIYSRDTKEKFISHVYKYEDGVEVDVKSQYEGKLNNIEKAETLTERGQIIFGTKWKPGSRVGKSEYKTAHPKIVFSQGRNPKNVFQHG